MGAAIGIGLASMGNAFMKSYLDTTERERRQKIEDEERAWQREERDAVRSERAKKAKLDSDIADAAAPRTTMSGTVTQSDAGQVFSATPENARAMQDTLAAEAELRDGPVPTQQAGHAITGSMSKGHQIAIGGLPEGPADTPDAQNERMLNAYRKNGQWEKALQMEESIIGIKAKRMGLQVDEFKFLDQKANRELAEMVPFTPMWHQDAASFLTNNQSSPLKGMNVKATPSEDGKTVNMVITGLNGAKQAVWTLPNSEEGWAKFMERAQSADLSVKLAALKDARAQAQEQANKDRDYDLRKSEAESNQSYRERLLGIQEAQEKRATDIHAKTMANDKIPPAVKEQAALLADQIKSVSSALNKAMAEGSFDASNPGTQRLLEQQAALGLRYSQLIKPYTAGTTSGAAAGADPLGFGGGAASSATPANATRSAGAPAQATSAAAAPGATRVAPQVQTARDTDARAILQGELAQAQQRLAAGDPRAQADIDSIQREIARMGGRAANTTMGQVVSQGPQAAAPQARPVATMAPATQPAPAAPPVRVQAQTQAAQPSLAQIIAGPGASPALLDAVRGRASAIEAAAADVKTAQAAVVSAAKAGNQASVKQAMDQAAAAGERLRQMLAGMNQQQAAIVIKAVGLQ